MLIRVAILLTLCSMLLISCSVSKETIESQSLQYPMSVNVSLYRSDSIKPQPELIDVISDAKLLETATKEIQNADPNATIPMAEKNKFNFLSPVFIQNRGNQHENGRLYVC